VSLSALIIATVDLGVVPPGMWVIESRLGFGLGVALKGRGSGFSRSIWHLIKFGRILVYDLVF